VIEPREVNFVMVDSLGNLRSTKLQVLSNPVAHGDVIPKLPAGSYDGQALVWSDATKAWRLHHSVVSNIITKVWFDASTGRLRTEYINGRIIMPNPNSPEASAQEGVHVQFHQCTGFGSDNIWEQV